MTVLPSDVGPFDALTDRWLIEALSQMSSNPRVRCAAAAWLDARRTALELGLAEEEAQARALDDQLNDRSLAGHEASAAAIRVGSGWLEVKWIPRKGGKATGPGFAKGVVSVRDTSARRPRG